MTAMHDKFRKFDPAVDKRLLVVLSGLMWSGVGIMLLNLAVRWLQQVATSPVIWYGAGGTMLALMIHHFGFLKLVDRNIERITAMEGKVCIFGFQPWKSYLIIIIMIGMGTVLRHSALPKQYLAIIYIGFGGAMVLSSIRYFRIFFRLYARKS